ncbi:ABC transporter permease [Streptomyces sp. 549]|uniref:ABC transporter permease n=1 Tax=Streptomyces sp. 549 TaxID=3049076 RepID=UPI0024C2BA41|nr:ABC transporter permease [Streptomyces sp. 549]MDK1473040.1 ABC transporter permease [Streptomyces sp. 549]
MSTTTVPPARADGDRAPGAARTRTAGRLLSLSRAELTLLARNRTAVFTALLMPLGMVLLLRVSLGGGELEGSALTGSSAVVTGGIGVVLVLVVYINLVAAFVTRREELVLKRLRTGEAADVEILTGTAVPSALLAFVQVAVLVVAGTLVFGLAVPRRPDLLLAGLVLAVVTLTALAAATAAFTRTAESAQITALPLMAVSFFGSGMFVPLDLLPDQVASVCGYLPMTPVMDLVRYGWLGAESGVEPLRALGLAVAWTALSVFAVRRWFRWEPRR